VHPNIAERKYTVMVDKLFIAYSFFRSFWIYCAESTFVILYKPNALFLTSSNPVAQTSEMNGNERKGYKRKKLPDGHSAVE
jgi:hypothetical protein